MPRRLHARDGLNGWDAAGAPDAVVVGLDPQFTYQKLTVAVDCVRHGARFVATNRDPVYPTERGMRPGAGSIVAARGGRGRGRPDLDRQARAAAPGDGRPGAGIRVGEAVMIGDGIATDLAAAVALGIPCILMLTGVSSPAGVDRRSTARPAPDARGPDCRLVARRARQGLAHRGPSPDVHRAPAAARPAPTVRLT